VWAAFDISCIELRLNASVIGFLGHVIVAELGTSTNTGSESN
jgi:hypothetical protein